MTTELFPPDEVTGPPLRSARLAKARRLLADVEALAWNMEPTFHDDCTRVAERAERMGAHSVARAVRRLCNPETLDRHGYDAMHSRAEGAALRYLAQIEAAP